MVERNYYLILGVQRDESAGGIRRAFRRLVKRYHPDVVGPRWTTQYQEIIEAYEVLSNPERRESYNRGLEQSHGLPGFSDSIIVSGYGPEPEPMVPGPISLIHDFQTARDPFEALIDRFVRNFTGRNVPKAERPEGLTAEVTLSPDEALRGGRLPLSVPVAFPCPTCGGTGEMWPYRCGHCGGRGMLQEEETIVITIPAGVRSGTFFEVPLAGLGIQNLYLRVLIRIGSDS